MRDLLILASLLLLSGILLCFRGLSLFKILQMILSGLAFGSLGLRLQAYYGQTWLYFVAGALAIFGAVFGYKKYKFGVFLVCSFATFVVVFSMFWKKAVAILQAVAGDVLDSLTLLKVYIRSTLCGVDVKESLEGISEFQFASYGDEFSQMRELLQKGLLWAGIAAAVVGLLSLLLVDYVIICMTASLGATILAMLLGSLVNLVGPWYTFAVVSFTILGMVVQLGQYGRRRRRKVKRRPARSPEE
ncbi:MAG: hypothetical protein MJ105_05705 [Lachnospiraceae bacterium]|nr:hypothetical protein [Lachnospiraceae bacterium]